MITALNLSNFAADGPLPSDRIPKNRAFKTSHLAPFATNMQFQRECLWFCFADQWLTSFSQVLSCDYTPDPQIRLILNDGVVPLGSVRGCPADEPHGLCPVPAFVAAVRETVATTDWAWACLGDWEVPEGHGWNTTTGEPPLPPSM